MKEHEEIDKLCALLQKIKPLITDKNRNTNDAFLFMIDIQMMSSKIDKTLALQTQPKP